ncbi:UNVERIFIED_CONTAM: hypothetical protein Sangu_0372100 [Sesamum angustifolium]|uniref:Bifunctional inhibitor/plant lipid transfer protein/seed storage helical domain-containing protein n=1 Tax=Sesamum angustifolium TaxID=2727405 RepID=A0AAW2QSD7_9LAMI
MLLLLAKAKSMWVPNKPIDPDTPLCASQIALANRACAALPYTPLPPPAPPGPRAPDGPGSGHCRRREHEHGHRHWRRETVREEECCRWLKEVDNACVCDVLLHLPSFLTRPVHNYVVIVDDTCDVKFECGSRLVGL